MELAIVVVHYHAGELTVAAVDRVHRDASAAGLSHEIVVIDNGSSAEDRRRFAEARLTVIDPGSNLGYAGGVNLGASRTSGDALMVMNPDVLVEPGCVSRLCEELARGAAVAGPRMYWDRVKRLQLPPAEVQGRRAEIARLAAESGERPASWWRRRHRRHARRHWMATIPIESFALSGALLALRRDALARVGPFDEGYPLYFEETDWLLRARRAGLSSRFVPGAEAVHLFNRSARGEPRAAGWFLESQRRFRDRHFGSWFRRALEHVGGTRWFGAPSHAAAPALPREGITISRPRGRDLWIEISPNRTGVPAAGERLPPDAIGWDPPLDVLGSLPGASWTIRLVDDAGTELALASASG